jgi:hypothetical protein
MVVCLRFGYICIALFWYNSNDATMSAKQTQQMFKKNNVSELIPNCNKLDGLKRKADRARRRRNI